MFTALPHGCAHLPWTWLPAPDGSDDPLHQPAAEQFATWPCEPGGEPAELPVRQREVAAQGLVMVGEPHLCQTDPGSGQQLWAVQLAEPSS